MGGDDMEISSEHGRNIGDEDIDIDIDLTTGQADEDYILDDVEPHEGFQDRPQHNALPDVNTDDLMIDEDDNSYVMDDADIEPDGGQMESEAIEMPYETGESVTDPFAGMDPEALVQHTTDISVEAPEISWEQPQQAEEFPPVVEVGTETSDSNGATDQVDTVYDPLPKEPVDVPEEATEHSQSQEATSTDLHTVDEKRLLSPAEAVIESHSPPIEKSGSHADSVSEVASIVGHSDRDGDNQVEIGKELTPPPNIIVVYQAAEYALFSTSENDDPDSYFLADVSIIQKSLSSLFSSIREIIQDDLSPEDELCLAVEVLGLETDETSASLFEDVSLGQIVDVYQKLLQNDGVEPDHPLNVMLGVRPKFTTRLANLSTQATEGHGLSKITTWHDESESAEDTAEATQTGSLEIPESQNYYHGEINQASPDEVDDPDATDVVHVLEKESSREPQQSSEVTKLEMTDHETSGENQALDNSTFMSTATQEGLHTTETRDSVIANDKNEENDLLDYEDEDVHQVNKSNRSYVHETEADQGNTKTEYAVVNGASHPGSASPKREYTFEPTDEHEQSNEHLGEHEAPPEQEDDSSRYVEKSDDQGNEDDQHREHELVGLENEQAQYPEEVGEDDTQDELNYERESEAHEGFIYGSNELGQTTAAVDNLDARATFDDHSNSNYQHDKIGEQEEPEYNGPDGEEEHEYNDTGEEEPDFTDVAIENRRGENTGQDTSPTPTSPVQNNPSSGNYTLTDLVESESATMSANTLEADEIDLGEGQDDTENGNSHNAHNPNEHELKEQEDEIDYDDEDELDVAEHQNIAAPEIASEPKGSSGKRPREVTNLEDIFDEDSQEAKRPRS